MKARPILFSAQMIRALLAGTKTQTRRTMKPQPPFWAEGCYLRPDKRWIWVTDQRAGNGPGPGVGLDLDAHFPCPYGVPGDLLWVRETWSRAALAQSRELFFRASDGERCAGRQGAFSYLEREPRWRSSIHMPRWASRLTLRITDVRVQRLQKISEADARAEGASWHDGSGIGHSGWRHDQADGYVWDTARTSYFHLWNRINGEGSVAQKDWTWALTFEVIKQNVDAVLASRAAT